MVIFGVLPCPACSHHPALFEATGHNGWSLCKLGWDIGNGLMKHSSCQQDEAEPKASLLGWVSPSLGLSPSFALRAMRCDWHSQKRAWRGTLGCRASRPEAAKAG